MLASISPVGEATRRQRWWVTTGAYTLGSAIGGTALGALLGGLGDLARLGTLAVGWRLGALGLVLVAGAALDARWGPTRLPSWRRQVDERWLTTYRGWVYGAGYGLQLGFAVVTIITSAVTYAALSAAVLAATAAGGALIGLTFGIVRALPLVATGLIRTPQRLRRLHAGLAQAARPVERTTIGVQIGAALVAGSVLVVGVG